MSKNIELEYMIEDILYTIKPLQFGKYKHTLGGKRVSDRREQGLSNLVITYSAEWIQRHKSEAHFKTYHLVLYAGRAEDLSARRFCVDG